MNTAYVIAGASLAGAKAAETLREEGFGGPLVLIGEETERPYERPPLSKDYLLGKADRETIYVHPQAWYADHGRTRRTRCAAITPTPGRCSATCGRSVSTTATSRRSWRTTAWPPLTPAGRN